jgi:hypothetical protein
MKLALSAAFLGLLCPSLCAAPCRGAAIDLAKAVVVADAHASPPGKKAVDMLVDEVHKRTQLRWAIAPTWPAAGAPAIVVGQAAQMPTLAGRFAAEIAKQPTQAAAEGYRIRVLRDQSGPAAFVIGSDARGVLFGVGRLLRMLRMSAGQASLDSDFEIETAPAYPLRGHQLGYRPKTNSYDAWDLKQWEQYYRDLAVFGANAVELIPPRSDDAATSPHFPLPPLEMMAGMSGLADQYGLDVWIWYPAMDRDYADPATVESALAEWGNVFKHLPRIDAVFVPGGDPGHTQPKHLLALLEEQTRVLHRTHPNAQMWVSPQSFNQQWLDEFLEILKRDEPKWLGGVVFGPQVRMSLPQLRAAIPKRYPLRHYPDITHCRQCQYPVPDWDVAFAVAEGRECINPRPLGQATIFRLLQPYTIGFLTYSEGCNDDVNKAVWSGLGWDPKADVTAILRDYAGYFIGERYRDDFAKGLLALERSWRGSISKNEEIETTLAQFQAMEKNASPEVKKNWRFQQALYRAYCDAYIQRRLSFERAIEANVLKLLRSTQQGETLEALREAERILNITGKPAGLTALKTRIEDLAADLFQSIRMQTSVAKYQAISVDRGATLDLIDYPLNNRLWLLQRIAALKNLQDEQPRLRGIREIANWTDPGPGGFYDDLGHPGRQPHIVVGEGFKRDPAFLSSSHNGFAGPDIVRQPRDGKLPKSQAWRMSWLDHAESLVDAPLLMKYTDLDPNAKYRLRIVYAGDTPRTKIRLETGGGVEIHPMIEKPRPIAPLEFDIPVAATQSGELVLRWNRQAGLGGNGRGCQVSEIWLMKNPPNDEKSSAAK